MPKKVKFVYYKPEDYKIHPVNGVWGGPTGRGDIVVHFFVERHEIPKEHIHSVNEDGSLGPLEREEKEMLQVARELQVGIMLSPREATNIAKWLNEQVEKFKEFVPKKEGEVQVEPV